MNCENYLNKLQTIYYFSYYLIDYNSTVDSEFAVSNTFWNQKYGPALKPKLLNFYDVKDNIFKILYVREDTESVVFVFNETENLSHILNSADIIELFHLFITQGSSLSTVLKNELRQLSSDVSSQKFKPIQHIKSLEFNPIDPLKGEVELFSQITYGNRKNLIKLNDQFVNQLNLGMLSKNSTIQHNKNVLIVTTTLAARYAIAGGVSQPLAYSISDKIIQDIDADQKNLDLKPNILNILLLYCDEVIKAQKVNMSMPIRKVRDFIQDHTYSRIDLDDLADISNYSKTYLSKKFKDETGISITDFIHERKCAEAKLLIRFTDLDLTDIAHELKFADYSHFAKVFKKVESITPYRYLQQNRFINMPHTNLSQEKR